MDGERWWWWYDRGREEVQNNEKKKKNIRTCCVPRREENVRTQVNGELNQICQLQVSLRGKKSKVNQMKLSKN